MHRESRHILWSSRISTAYSVPETSYSISINRLNIGSGAQDALHGATSTPLRPLQVVGNNLVNFVGQNLLANEIDRAKGAVQLDPLDITGTKVASRVVRQHRSTNSLV